MKPVKISNIFSKEELNNLTLITNSSKKDIDPLYGRQKSIKLNLNKNLYAKLNSIVKEVWDVSLIFGGVNYVEYNKEFGVPFLPPHFDGDSSELIVNFQLSSNTTWQVGVDLELFTLEDNSAILFHPNESVHWRPNKIFNNGEYVKMMFFRYSANPPKNYSHMNLSVDDVRFNEINNLRDKIKHIV
jgi:hypothetical protein